MANEMKFKSKILHPLHKLVRAVIDVFYFSATGQGRNNKHKKGC